MDTRTEIRLRLTPQEVAGLAALTVGLRGVTEAELTEEDAAVAALELALTRLIEDFEVPDESARARVQQARDELRAHWVRGGASL
ncbi:hypothetical protein [Kribbella sp. NPDC049227]|uniref:hypothetical protein n=1 Tax=Kribbella sp. NPDC049227 TaxID=3364113 RepID=UPI003719B3C5